MIMWLPIIFFGVIIIYNLWFKDKSKDFGSAVKSRLKLTALKQEIMRKEILLVQSEYFEVYADLDIPLGDLKLFLLKNKLNIKDVVELGDKNLLQICLLK